MADFVLVSGAWHAGWCWERIVPLLEAGGHHVVAPDLAGMGADRTPPSAVSLATWADQIADVVRQQGGPVILVGHSRGGVVISEVAERVPELIATLVYLTAFLVPSGDTLLATMGRVPREDASDILVALEDGTTTVRSDAIEPTFYNMTEPKWVERVKTLLSPEPMAAFATPLHLSDAAFGSVERAYIECTRDNALPLELQRAMQASLPCSTVFTLETDHSPFYSAPEELVECLERLT